MMEESGAVRRDAEFWTRAERHLLEIDLGLELLDAALEQALARQSLLA